MPLPASADNVEEITINSHNTLAINESVVFHVSIYTSKWAREQVSVQRTCKLCPCPRGSFQVLLRISRVPPALKWRRLATINRPVAGERHVNKDATGDVFIRGRWNY